MTAIRLSYTIVVLMAMGRNRPDAGEEEVPMAGTSLSSERYRARDALEAIDLCFQKGWTDGLPVVPPVESRVKEFVEYTGRDPGEVLGRVVVRGRTITVEKVAINAVMAGCLPEYMPVVLAAVEAMCQPPYNLHGSSASTGGSAPLVIVSGPVARKLDINAGTNLFGPGFRANATIGRALRLFLMNVCGNVPGVYDRSTMGHPGKYSYCIAENDAGSPWEPLHVEKGLPANSSAVTVFPALGPRQVRDSPSGTADGLATSFAATVAGMGEYGPGSDFGLKYCAVVIGAEHMAVIAREGWTKKQFKEAVFLKSRRTLADLKRWGMMPGAVEKGGDGKVLPAVSAADEIMVIPAGGGGIFGACIAPWSAGKHAFAVTRPVAN